MSTVFVDIGLSLDGYMAPEGMTLEHWDRPEYKDWGAKWGALMSWILNQRYFRENLREPVPRLRIDKVVDSPAATHLRYVREQGWPNNRSQLKPCSTGCVPAVSH